MKQIKLTVLIIFAQLFLVCPVHSAVVFSDDFELGNFSRWTGQNVAGGSVTIDAVTRKAGSYGMRAVDSSTSQNQVYEYRDFTLSTFNCRFYVYFPAGFFSAFAAGNYRNIYNVDASTSGSRGLRLRINDAHYLLAQETLSWQNKTGTTYINEDTWYCIEIKMPQCVSGASLEWWIDGVAQQPLTGCDFSFAYSWKWMRLGSDGGGNVNAILQTMNFDEVVVDDTSYIGLVPDAPSPGNLQFSAANYNGAENGGSAAVTVNRVSGSSGTVTVQYATANNTAAAGSDYTAASGTLSWGNADTAAKTFTVGIINDTSTEGSETLNLALSNPTGGAGLGNPVGATVTITDDDTPGTVQFSGSSFSGAENGLSVTVTVSRSGGSGGAASVQYATSNGSASAGSDYTAKSGTLNWPAGDSANKTFTVGLIDDTAQESGESVNLILSNVSGASLGSPSNAVLTILDDEITGDSHLWLHVEGKYIKTSTTTANPPGQVFIPAGFCYGKKVVSALDDVGAASFAKSHYCNTVRLTCKGVDPANYGYTSVTDELNNHIAPWMTVARQYKLYTLMDNHEFYGINGRNLDLTSTEQETLKQFWETVVTAYIDEPLMFIELWNEIYFSNSTPVLQDAITRLRAIDRKHIIVLPYGSPGTVSDVLSPAQLVYNTHPYPANNEPASQIVSGTITKMNSSNVPFFFTEFGGGEGGNRNAWSENRFWTEELYSSMVANKAGYPIGSTIWYEVGIVTAEHEFEGAAPGFFDVWVEGVKNMASPIPNNGIAAKVLIDPVKNWHTGMSTGEELTLSIRVADALDSTVVTSNASLSFSISGPGILQDIPTGAVNGTAAVKVKAGTTPGTVIVTAMSGSLTQAQLSIPVVERWANFASMKLDSTWAGESEPNDDTSPDVRVNIQDNASGLDTTTARWEYSRDGGATWTYWNPSDSDEFDDATLNTSRWTSESHESTGGSASESGGRLTISGAGEDVYSTWGTGWYCDKLTAYDQFHYVHESRTGGYEIITKIDSQQNTDPWALAGIMAREQMVDNYDNSYCYVAVTPSNGFVFAWKSLGARTSNGNTDKPGNFIYIDARVNSGTSVYPCYLKLVKRRNVNYYDTWIKYYNYSGWYSQDGVNWTLIYRIALEYANHTERVGMFVCSGLPSTQGAAVFDFYRSQLYASCSGSPNTVSLETQSISAVPFNQNSVGNNKIRFKIQPRVSFLHLNDSRTEPEYVSPVYTVITGQAGPAARVMLSADPSSIRANGTSTAVVTARVTDASGYTCNTASNTITFGITGEGTLQGGPVVQAVEGIATITLRSTANNGTAVVTAATPGLTSGNLNFNTYGDPVAIEASADKTKIYASGISSAVVTGTVVDDMGHAVLDAANTLTFTITGAGTFTGGYKVLSSMAQNGAVNMVLTSRETGNSDIVITGTGGLAQDSISIEAARNYTDGDTVLRTSASGAVRLVIQPNSMDKNVIIAIRSRGEITTLDSALSGRIDTACKPVSQSGTIPDEDIMSGKIKYSDGLWDNSVYDFNPADVQTSLETTVNFNPAATLVIPYSETDGNITGTDIPESSLAIYLLDETNNIWVKQNSVVNTAANEVSLAVTHLSVYCLMGGEEGEPVIGEITNVASYPNPFNPATGTGNVKFIYNLPSAGDVRVEVFTLAGKLITTLTRTGAAAGYGEISWDGTDDDANEIANGLYLYKVTLVSGGSETSKIGKLAKIR